MKTRFTGIRRVGGAALIGALASSCVLMQEAETHDWVEEPHHFSILLARTIETDQSSPSVGLDYEYRSSDFLGVGAVLEHAFTPIHATTFIAAADLHLTDQLIVQTGPGLELVEDDERAVYRLGILYELEHGGYTCSPQLHYDWASGEDAVVIGLALGVGF